MIFHVDCRTLLRSMKRKLLTALLVTRIFSSTAQVPDYEYVPYQKANREANIALPDFTVQLKRTLKEEKAEFKQPQRLFVVSDIEGQYEGFKSLLQAAGVIDKSFKWTFGRGHLVVCGDVFDRGSQVAECLWLIYHLEEKAKQAGGYVHFILGNHEIMNLNGDLRHLHPKYLELARQKGVDYNNFYNEQTELGRWLHTKNIVEKIGKLLLLHGGISQYINQWGQPLDSINIVARAHYGRYNDSLLRPEAQLVLFDDGPLWYRGYYMAPLASQAQVDSTLHLFGAEKVITGHTPVERIRTFYEGKVINIDVPHAKGTFEGLFIEDKKYYRLSLHGGKELLLANNRSR
jgi:hypothetical protein